jgi:hypothetical protein
MTVMHTLDYVAQKFLQAAEEARAMARGSGAPGPAVLQPVHRQLEAAVSIVIRFDESLPLPQALLERWVAFRARVVRGGSWQATIGAMSLNEAGDLLDELFSLQEAIEAHERAERAERGSEH